MIFEERFDAATVSNVRAPASANFATWCEADKMKCRPFAATRHVEKIRRDNGTFSLTTTHGTDTRFELQDSRPYQTVVDQNGSRATAQNGQILSSSASASGESASFIAENMGRKPNFGTMTVGEIAELETQGWAVQSLAEGQTLLTRPKMDMRIVPIDRLVEVTRFGLSGAVEGRKTTFYRRDEAGYLMPREEVESKFWQLSSGDPVERRTVTTYSNYFIAESVSPHGKALAGGSGPFSGQIVPNPVGDQFLVDLPERLGETMDVRVFDQTGRMVVERLGQPVEALQIEAVGLAPGSYVVRVDGAGLRLALPLLKL